MTGIVDISGTNSGVISSSGISYEEGEFTVTPHADSNSHVTFSNHIGRYIKIGRFVNVWGYVDVSAVDSHSDPLTIELPFTVMPNPAGGSGNSSATGQCIWHQVNLTGDQGAFPLAIPNTTKVIFIADFQFYYKK